jgi:hypothetical protein
VSCPTQTYFEQYTYNRRALLYFRFLAIHVKRYSLQWPYKQAPWCGQKWPIRVAMRGNGEQLMSFRMIRIDHDPQWNAGRTLQFMRKGMAQDSITDSCMSVVGTVSHLVAKPDGRPYLRIYSGRPYDRAPPIAAAGYGRCPYSISEKS